MGVHRKIVCFIRHKADNNRYNNYYCHIFDKVSEYCLHIFIFTLCPAIVIYISARIRIYYITFYALCQSFCIVPKEKPPQKGGFGAGLQGKLGFVDYSGVPTSIKLPSRS